MTLYYYYYYTVRDIGIVLQYEYRNKYNKNVEFF